MLQKLLGPVRTKYSMDPSISSSRGLIPMVTDLFLIGRLMIITQSSEIVPFMF
jgi:hypothetical protein